MEIARQSCQAYQNLYSLAEKKFSESNINKLNNEINTLSEEIKNTVKNTKSLQDIIVNISPEAKSAFAACYTSDARKDCVEKAMNSHEFNSFQKEDISIYMEKHFAKSDVITDINNNFNCNKYTELLNKAYPEDLRRCNEEAKESQSISKQKECVQLGKALGYNAVDFDRVSHENMACNLELLGKYADAMQEYSVTINNHQWHESRPKFLA